LIGLAIRARPDYQTRLGRPFGSGDHERTSGKKHSGSGRKTTTALGNGADSDCIPSASTKRSRPRSRRTSPRMHHSCHHLVSVRAGTRHTTVEPARDDSQAFSTQVPMVRPYGGFIQHRNPDQSCSSPSSSRVQNLVHFAFCGVAHTSTSNLNSRFSARNSSSGVPHSGVFDVLIASVKLIGVHRAYMSSGLSPTEVCHVFTACQGNRRNQWRTRSPENTANKVTEKGLT